MTGTHSGLTSPTDTNHPAMLFADMAMKQKMVTFFSLSAVKRGPNAKSGKGWIGTRTYELVRMF
jgi:hypothetical protein